MGIREIREKMLRYDYTIWRYTEGEEEAILLDYGRFGCKKLAFKVAKMVKADIVRETDRIVVRKIPIKIDEDSEYVNCQEWEVR